MANLLLPYGAKKYAALTAKEGVVKSARAAASRLAPYGTRDNAYLAAKVGLEKRDRSGLGARRVIRLARG